MGFKVAVVGATGNVGREMLSVLAERKFPASEVVALASTRSIGTEVSFGDGTLKVKALDYYDFKGTDICLMSAGGTVSKEWSPKIAAAGAIVIDNSSHWRMDRQVPLVVPEVNADALDGGIKKGIIEQADMVAVNKADVDPARARQAAAEYGGALRILAPASPDWTPPVLLVSGLANQGLVEMWGEIERHRAVLSASGELVRKRARQQIKWMWALLEERLMLQVLDNDAVRAELAEIEREVGQGALAPEAAVKQILALAKTA